MEELVEEGLIIALPGSGYYVKETDIVEDFQPSLNSEFTKPLRLSEFAKRVRDVHAEMQTRWLEKLPDINYGTIPSTLTPHKEWERMMRRYCRATDIDTLTPTIQPFGYPPLREAVAAYLHRARAVKCDNRQVAIFSSKQLRLELITRILINPGDYVAFEEPAYAEAKYLLKAHGAIIRPVATDEQGLVVDELFKDATPVKMIYVTPSHQDPTGSVMSLERRKKLLHWAYKTGTIIIEDDYDCEYRYGKKSLPSLQALDEFDNVIYLASIWKSLSLVGFGFTVFPRRLADVAQMAKMEMEKYLPVAEQVALTDLINEGHLEKYLRKSQAKLALRRQEMILALAKYFKNRLSLFSEGAGTHLVVRFISTSENLVVETAKVAGISIMSTASYYEESPRQGEFMLPFACYQNAEVDTRVKKWADELKKRLAKHATN